MLKFCILAAIVAVSTSNFLDEGAYRIYTNQKQFSLKMLDALCTKYPNENIFFSPHSTYRALLLAYFGAEGQTEVSLKQGLNLDWATSKEEVLAAYKTGLEAIESRSFGDEVEFKTVDKVYITKDAKLKSHITDVLTNKQIERVNFARPDAVRARVNAQVAEATNQHIKDLLAPGSVTSNSNIVLTNAAFFKGLWASPFDKDMTSNETFHGATDEITEMMYVSAKVSFGELAAEDADFCELDYKEEHYSMIMTIFKPKSGTVDSLVKRMTPRTFNNTEEAGKHEQVAIKLPKMSFDKDYPLASILEGEMGITNLFGSGSNLSGFADNVAVSFDDIVHKAVFSADEEGSTAAAATATIGRGISPVFFANSPFVFTITDNISKEVLFAGVYRGPKN